MSPGSTGTTLRKDDGKKKLQQFMHNARKVTQHLAYIHVGTVAPNILQCIIFFKSRARPCQCCVTSPAALRGEVPAAVAKQSVSLHQAQAKGNLVASKAVFAVCCHPTWPALSCRQYCYQI